MFTPSKKIVPSVGSISLRMVIPKVLFPQPDSPTTPRVFPSSILTSTPSTACRKPEGTLKYFYRAFVSTSVFDITTSPSEDGEDSEDDSR